MTATEMSRATTQRCILAFSQQNLNGTANDTQLITRTTPAGRKQKNFGHSDKPEPSVLFIPLRELTPVAISQLRMGRTFAKVRPFSSMA